MFKVTHLAQTLLRRVRPSNSIKTRKLRQTQQPLVFLEFLENVILVRKNVFYEIHCARSNVYTNVYTNLYKINVQVSVQVTRKCTG